MRKLKNTIAAAMLFCSLTAGTQLFAQNDANTGNAQTNNRNDDDSGKLGLLGLVGLLGLLGLRKRDVDIKTRTSRNP